MVEENQADTEEAPRKKGSKKRKVFFLVALIGAIFAAVSFWRRRGSEEEFEE